MRTEILFIQDIFKNGRCFMVPIYQRTYQWDEKRITAFWDDAEEKATLLLEDSGCVKHYMGALILSPLGRENIATTPCVEVIDGQQRLTTFQLFLSALKDVADDHGMDDIIAAVKDYLFNQRLARDYDELTRFKIKPTDVDREMFHYIIDNSLQNVRQKYPHLFIRGRVPKNSGYRSLRAFYFFYTQIDRFVRKGPRDIGLNNEEEQSDGSGDGSREEIRIRLNALMEALLRYMKLVVIHLDDNDDAQVIFETLNSKGQPLRAMDLVRNNILHRAEENDRENLHKEFLKPFDDAWWRINGPNSRPKRPRTDHFLAYMLAAETGKPIAVRELYSEYRTFVNPGGVALFDNVEDELKVLRCHSPIFETLEGRINENDVMAWLGRKFAIWQLTTPYPIMLQVAKAQLLPDEQKRIGRLVYSYIVRRAVCGLSQQAYNQVFRAISQLFLPDRELRPSYNRLKDFFRSREGDSNRFPTDADFRRGILTTKIYNAAPGDRHKDILWELNLKSGSPATERVEKPSGLWTEHVLPQTWTEDWPFIDGEYFPPGSDHPTAQKRRELIQTLGNLTLTTRMADILAGNNSFTEKRPLYEDSVLALNKWIARQRVWTENEIDKRGYHLADMAMEIWPGID